MTSTGTPHVPLRSRWPALLVTVAARAVLVVLVSLLGWSLVPAALGWHPTVVMTGSMQPKLVPGDVVVSRPIEASQLAVGQVLLVDNPDQPGELRLHRLIRFGAHGELVTRGDANRSADSTPVARSAVRGVGALHIPYLGLPYLWASDGQTGPLILTGLALLVLIALAVLWRPVRADNTDDETPNQSETESAQRTQPVEEAVEREPLAVALVRYVAPRLALITLVAGVAVAASAGVADAATKFTTKSANPTSTWAASSWFTCANAVVGDGAASALPLSESRGTDATDISGNDADGTYSDSGVTYRVTGPCTHDNRTAVTLDGSAGEVTGGTPGNTAMTFEIWFKATGSHGGVLMSVLSNSGRSKAALAMTSSGTLIFADGSSSAAVSTTSSYNNGGWHLAVATVGAAGMALYVDAQPAVTSTAATTVSGNNSTVNIGYGNSSTLSTGSNDYFRGSVAFASWYTKALTAAQVSAHYAAAN